MQTMGKDLHYEDGVRLGQQPLKSEAISARNQLVEYSTLENFTIRFPSIMVNAHFHWCYVKDAEYEIGEHAHRHWEITRVSSGQIEYGFPERDVSVRPDSNHYLIIPPKTTHRWKALSGDVLLDGWQVIIEPDDAEGRQVLDRMESFVCSSGFMVEATAQQINIDELLWDMSGKKYSPQIFGSVLCGFARIVIGDLLAMINPWPEGSLDSHSDPHMAVKNLAGRMRRFLDENLSLPITVKEMESHFHYSGRHLNRIFKDIYNVSIGHYLRMQRIDLSKRWLKSTNRSIKDIALSLGYSSSSQFCRYFLKQTGKTPSEYRHSASKVEAGGFGTLEPLNNPDNKKEDS